MNKKIRVGIIFGGKSAEHEVSLQSAKSIYEAIDKTKYDVSLIGIDKQGYWQLSNEYRYLSHPNDPKLIEMHESTNKLVVSPGSNHQLAHASNGSVSATLDVVFPVLHGTYGEDGSIQGMLKMLDLPYVGPDILGSAIGMDKDVTKRLLHQADVNVTKFEVFRVGDKITFLKLKKKYGLPMFIKPANLGSSVGVSKVTNEKELKNAVKLAFKYDVKILVEQAVVGREIEVSVLGNENPIASVPGEVITQNGFYSYEAKYIDENGALLEVPAKLSRSVVKKIQNTALKTYKTLCLEGMARVDMFLTPTGKIVINEVNTIPGFTNISMYPKLWEASGLSYGDLLDRLIELALKRHNRQHQLKTSV